MEYSVLDIGAAISGWGAVIGVTVAMVASYYLWWWAVAQPAAIARQLRAQGVFVLPYNPATLGNMLELARSLRLSITSTSPLPFPDSLLPARVIPFYAQSLAKSQGEMFVMWFGPRPRLVVTDPEVIKLILTSNFKSYSKSNSSFHKMTCDYFGNGLLTANGDDWKTQRNALQPTFYPERLKGMMEDMHCAAMEMTSAWMESISKDMEGGSPMEVEVAHHFKNATADILARTCFGSGYQAGKGAFEKQTMLAPIFIKQATMNFIIPGWRYFPSSLNNRYWSLKRSIEKELSTLVESRLDSNYKPTGKVDLLDAIIFYAKSKYGPIRKGISPKASKPIITQVIDQCKTFFVAGHETTSHMLTWTTMLLSIYPEWQEKLRGEVLEICGAKTGVPTMEQVNKLKLMGMVFNESLRLYPTVPTLFSRIPTLNGGNFKLGDLVLPQGVTFSIPTVFIHRSKKIWGDDVDIFRPERFHEGVLKACKHPFGYLPFGLGTRTCIGQSFAILEAKMIMIAILRQFCFSLSSKYRHCPEFFMTMQPKNGLHIIVNHIV